MQQSVQYPKTLSKDIRDRIQKFINYFFEVKKWGPLKE